MKETDQLWFILINGQQSGPYSLLQLKEKAGFTPDTLVRRSQSEEWVAARDEPELKDVFKDDVPPQNEEIEAYTAPPASQELVLGYQEDPSQFYLWLLVFLTLAIYILYFSQDPA